MKSQSLIPGDKCRLPCLAQCPQADKQAGASHTPGLSSDGLRKPVSPALESPPLHTPDEQVAPGWRSRVSRTGDRRQGHTAPSRTAGVLSPSPPHKPLSDQRGTGSHLEEGLLQPPSPWLSLASGCHGNPCGCPGYPLLLQNPLPAAGFKHLPFHHHRGPSMTANTWSARSGTGLSLQVSGGLGLV